MDGAVELAITSQICVTLGFCVLILRFIYHVHVLAGPRFYSHILVVQWGLCS